MPQELKIYASSVNTTGANGKPQKRDLSDNEFIDGMLDQEIFSAQKYNQILHLLTVYAAPFHSTPMLVSDDVGIPGESLEMDGQAFSAVTYPNLALAYTGLVLPDLITLSPPPAGFTWIVRAS